MRDMSALQDRVIDQIKNQCFMTIVCEAFLGAVPIYEQDLTTEVKQGLVQYATEALNDMGGFDLLENAIKACKDPAGASYLRNVRNICMESANMVADRVVDAHKDDNDIDEIVEAANNVGMTSDEYAKFAEGAKRVTPDTLTDMISEKVLDTVKAEKEAYQKDAELETEVKAALSETGADKETVETPDIQTPDAMISEPGVADVPTEDEAEVAAEEAFQAYGKGMVGDHASFRPQHQTLFSTLQEMAMEGLMYGKERKADLPYHTMGIITRRRTFPVFKSNQNASPIAALENLCMTAIDSMGTPDAPPTEDDHKKALLTASIIYTFFETLNTMNLYCPGLKEVKQVVDEHIPMSQLAEADKKTFLSGLSSIVANATKSARAATSIPEVDTISGELQAVREAASKAPSMESFMMEINQRCQPVFELCKQRRTQLGANPTPAVESDRDIRIRELDTEKFSSVASTRGPKSNVHSFRCVRDTRVYGPGIIAVESLDGRGVKVGQNLVRLDAVMESEKMDTYLQSVIGASNLTKHDKPVRIVDKDTRKDFELK